jgi:D-xylose transport system permease protein
VDDLHPETRLGESSSPYSSNVISRLIAWLRRISNGEVGNLPVVLALIIVGVYFQSQNSLFLSGRNLDNLLGQIAITGTLAIGVVLVLLIGEIDLSIGSVMGVSAGVLSVLLVVHGVSWWLAIAGMIGAALAIGAFQASLIAILGMPSFVVTLAGLLIWAGVELMIYGNSTALNVLNPNIVRLSTTYLPKPLAWVLLVGVLCFYSVSRVMRRRQRGRAGLSVASAFSVYTKIALFAVAGVVTIYTLDRWRGIPTSALIMIGLVCFFAWLTTRTQFGRHVYAIGGNVESARRAGVNVVRIRLTILILSSLMAAVAALLYVSTVEGAGTSTGGSDQLLEAIGAAVIGGASLFGGKGTIWAALLGALVFGSLSNGLDLTGQPASVKMVTEGAILLVAIGIDTFSRRAAAASSR